MAVLASSPTAPKHSRTPGRTRPALCASLESKATFARLIASNRTAVAPGVSRSSCILSTNPSRTLGSVRAPVVDASRLGKPTAQGVQPAQRRRRVTQRRGSHLDRCPIVRLEHQQPVGAGIALLEEVRQREHVPERLRHLLAPATLRPCRCASSARANGLPTATACCPFVLVMRKDEVLTATVQVKSLPEQCERHDDAFSVPAGSSRAPGRGPPRL